MSDEKKETEEINKWYKSKKLKDYGIFILILILLFGLLTVFTLLNRNAWNKGLREEINHVLTNNGYDNIQIAGESIAINSPFSTSCAAFYFTNKELKNEKAVAVILKVTTFYGPVGAVYVYEKKGSVKFIDFINCPSHIGKQNKDISKNMQITYWQKRIPSILPDVFNDAKGGNK